MFIASIGGTYIFTSGNGVYGATKAALNSMAKTLALELGPKNIRVNALCPGMIETPIIHQDALCQEQLDEDAQSYPLKRYGRPEEVAFSAIYLLSDASSYMTGSSLVIDGGCTL